MIDPSIQRLVEALQAALGTHVICGQVTLNLSEGRLQSVETKTYQRVVAKVIDKPTRLSA